MKTAVLYHNDADGFGAAYACWKAFDSDEKIFFRPVQYRQPVPELPETIEELFVVDFSYDRATCEALAGKYKLTVIDHHKTAWKELEGLPYVTFALQKSGAVLAWEHFFNGDSFTLLRWIKPLTHGMSLICRRLSFLATQSRLSEIHKLTGPAGMYGGRKSAVIKCRCLISLTTFLRSGTNSVRSSQKRISAPLIATEQTESGHILCGQSESSTCPPLPNSSAGAVIVTLPDLQETLPERYNGFSTAAGLIACCYVLL